jgi:hypothetical protein
MNDYTILRAIAINKACPARKERFADSKKRLTD